MFLWHPKVIFSDNSSLISSTDDGPLTVYCQGHGHNQWPMLSNDVIRWKTAFIWLKLRIDYLGLMLPLSITCSTVSSILSGLEARSLGLTLIRHNVVSSLVTVCPSQKCVYGLLGLISTKQGVKVTCSKPQRTATRPDLEPGTPWSVVRDANHCASPPPSISCHFVVYVARKFQSYRPPGDSPRYI